MLVQGCYFPAILWMFMKFQFWLQRNGFDSGMKETVEVRKKKDKEKKFMHCCKAHDVRQAAMKRVPGCDKPWHSNISNVGVGGWIFMYLEIQKTSQTEHISSPDCAKLCTSKIIQEGTGIMSLDPPHFCTRACAKSDCGHQHLHYLQRPNMHQEHFHSSSDLHTRIRFLSVFSETPGERPPWWPEAPPLLKTTFSDPPHPSSM